MATVKPIQPYAPASPPTSQADLSRAAWEELRRIAAMLNQISEHVTQLEARLTALETYVGYP